jgi:signal transduction histidine kinase
MAEDAAGRGRPGSGAPTVLVVDDDQQFLALLVRSLITVQDTGLGIPAEDLPHVFGRFYRGRNANAASGTGLGLAIGQWIAGQHGGRVEAASAPGDGSTFTIHLPLAWPAG